MVARLSNNSLEDLFSLLRDIPQKNDTTFQDYKAKVNKDDLIMGRNEISKRFLEPSHILSWEMLDILQDIPDMNCLNSNDGKNPDDCNYKQFLIIPSQISRTSHYFKRQGIEGKICSYKEEVNLKEIENANASNSLSLKRKISHHTSMNGSTKQLPFSPGGLTIKALEKSSVDSEIASATRLLHRDEQGLFDIPPGLERGIIPYEFPDYDANHINELNKLNIIDNEGKIKQEVEDERKQNEDIQTTGIPVISKELTHQDYTDVDDLLPMDVHFGRMVRRTKKILENQNWAHIVDLDNKIENFEELVPNPARVWDFDLDNFQKEAIYHLEQGDSVFVAAHTSAGKTVVAEYAIAMSKRNMTKTIYTSPIKALSNQKFRDFKEDFDDMEIGLITGDVQVNAKGNCLIMTTEILRSMLYRGADIIRDVEFVIFDEVHYVNDQDRGVVWEEVIIMLPQHVKFILLSATVPNTFEFANWVGRTKQKNIYVISTLKRPIPLEINVWAKEQLIPVVNENREFLGSNFKKHKDLLMGKLLDKPVSKSFNQGGASNNHGNSNQLRPSNRTVTKGSKGIGAIGSNNSQFFKKSSPNKKTWSTLVNFLRKKDLLPAVIFVFSKKRCEEYADRLEGTDFSTSKEKSQTYMFIEKSISRLKKDDRELPQIFKIRALLERGIAVHHGGILPIVKELIEILFSRGLIKVLFATETFAMGLNLPTRTVVFSEIQKHDGNNIRFLNPGEFTQMAGRAGRRGKDKTGQVIIMTYSTPIQETIFKETVLGVPTKLQSQFRLTYNMILNLLRIEALRVEEMIKFSFSEDSKQTLLPEHENKIKSLQNKLDNLANVTCEKCSTDIDTAVDLVLEYKTITKKTMDDLYKDKLLFRFLNTGRLVIYRDLDDNSKLGFIFRINPSERKAIILCITEPNKLSTGETNHLPYITIYPVLIKKMFNEFTKTDMYLEEILMESIELVTSFVLVTSFTDIMKKDPDALKELEESSNIILKISHKLKERHFEKKTTFKIQQDILTRKKIECRFQELKCVTCPEFNKHFHEKYQKSILEKQIKDIHHLMSDQNLSLLPDYEQRLAVLKETGFIDQSNNVSLKGRIACEINSGYELVLTELILDNFLGDFEPEEIVALLSAFVYEGRTNEEEPLITTPRLAKGKEKIQKIYSKMLDVYERHQIPLTKDEAEFLDRKRFALMNVVYKWACGLSFKVIMEMSVESEGTIVRVITRLDEICREVRGAAIIIGDSALHLKMSQAQELIKRDIVFAASLYL